jgi:thymidine kinase
MSKSRIDIIFGPMFAGKSSFLIKQIRLLKILDKKYIVIKPKIDNRYSKTCVVSHDMVQEPCVSLDNLNNIFKQKLDEIDTIFIDEAQFFSDLVKNVLKLVEEKHINVFVVGLDGDSNRNKFGEILDLIPYSNTCQKIHSLCKICKDGTPGIFSKRICSDKKQNLIGAEDSYISVCRKHYLDS